MIQHIESETQLCLNLKLFISFDSCVSKYCRQENETVLVLTCISGNLLHPCLHLTADLGMQHFPRDSGNEVMVNSWLPW